MTYLLSELQKKEGIERTRKRLEIAIHSQLAMYRLETMLYLYQEILSAM